MPEVLGYTQVLEVRAGVRRGQPKKKAGKRAPWEPPRQKAIYSQGPNSSFIGVAGVFTYRTVSVEHFPGRRGRLWALGQYCAALTHRNDIKLWCTGFRDRTG